MSRLDKGSSGPSSSGGVGSVSSSADSASLSHVDVQRAHLLVASAEFLCRLYRHLLAHQSDLNAGVAALRLSLSALSLLHQRREELQRMLSDRTRTQQQRATSIRGVTVTTLNKLFVMLATLVRDQGTDTGQAAGPLPPRAGQRRAAQFP